MKYKVEYLPSVVKMLEKMPSLRGMYNEEDGNTAVLYFESGVATIYSFTASPVTIKF